MSSAKGANTSFRDQLLFEVLISLANISLKIPPMQLFLHAFSNGLLDAFQEWQVMGTVVGSVLLMGSASPWLASFRC